MGTKVGCLLAASQEPGIMLLFLAVIPTAEGSLPDAAMGPGGSVATFSS